LLGPEGLTGSCSPAMLAELRQLERSADAQAATRQLQAIHRLAAAELPVIPLWQLVEHGAVRNSLSGVGKPPASLYENVAQWQIGEGK
jgi:ABC-type transport system substrate-binding protein